MLNNLIAIFGILYCFNISIFASMPSNNVFDHVTQEEHLARIEDNSVSDSGDSFMPSETEFHTSDMADDLDNIDENQTSQLFKGDDAKQLDGYKQRASIAILDKITGKSTIVNLQLNKVCIFNNLAITAHKCFVSELPSTTHQAFVRVVEHSDNDDAKEIFSGWLIAGNPAISTIVHPVYVLLMLKCL